MAKIIGITGLAGVGKDTLARFMAAHIRDTHGEVVTLAGFADPIRAVSNSMGLDPFTRATKEVKVTISLDVFCDSLQAAIDYNLSGRMNWSERQQLFVLTIDNVRKFVSPPVGTSLTEYINISPREFMQILGTEGGQAIRKTLWVDLQHGYWRSLDGIVLVTDFRFDHEVPALDQIVVVTRPGITRVNNHKSEDLPEELTILPTDKYEGRPVAYVHNRGSMEHLESLAVSLASNLVRGPVKG